MMTNCFLSFFYRLALHSGKISYRKPQNFTQRSSELNYFDKSFIIIFWRVWGGGFKCWSTTPISSGRMELNFFNNWTLKVWAIDFCAQKCSPPSQEKKNIRKKRKRHSQCHGLWSCCGFDRNAPSAWQRVVSNSPTKIIRESFTSLIFNVIFFLLNRSTLSVIAAYLDAFQKIADSATNAKGKQKNIP